MSENPSMIEEILGGPLEAEFDSPTTQAEISPDFSLNYLFNTMLLTQIKDSHSGQFWSIPQRNILRIIENRVDLLLAQSDMDDSEKNIVLSARKDIYLSVLDKLEELFCFSSMEATEIDPENWELDSLIQNVTALYTLMILNRKDTLVSFLTQTIIKNWSDIVAGYTEKIDKRRIRSLKNFLGSISKKNESEEVTVVYYYLSEICERLMGETVDAKSFFEILEETDEGEINLTLCKELVPGDNTDFFTALCVPLCSKDSYVSLTAAEVRDKLAPYIETLADLKEKQGE